MPTPIIFENQKHFCESINSPDTQNKFEEFFAFPEITDDLELLVKKSVDGTTFRAFRFRTNIVPGRPSEIYRTFTTKLLKAKIPQYGEFKSQAEFREWLIESTNELCCEWHNRTGGNQAVAMGFGRGIKLLNLSVKFSLRHSSLDGDLRKKLINWLEVPLDSYTLQGIRELSKQLFVDLGISRRASMGAIKTEAQYIAIQDEIRRLCSNCGADRYPIHYEIMAWNLAHRKEEHTHQTTLSP